MRPILLTDLDRLAQALIAVTPGSRETLCREVIARANLADRYRKRLRKAHPAFGTGTLSSAIPGSAPRGQIDRCTPDYLACLQVMLDCLADRQSDHIR